MDVAGVCLWQRRTIGFSRLRHAPSHQHKPHSSPVKFLLLIGTLVNSHTILYPTSVSPYDKSAIPEILFLDLGLGYPIAQIQPAMFSGRYSGRGLSNSQGYGASWTRGRERGSYRNGPWRRNMEVPRPPSPPLGPILTTLRESDLADYPNLHEGYARITDCKDVASYNWLNKNEPTILVPGL